MAKPWEKYQQPQGNVFQLPPDPMAVQREQRAAGGQAFDQRATQARLQNDAARVALARQAEARALAAERRAQQEFELNRQKATGQLRTITPLQRQQLTDRLTSLQNLEGVVSDLEGQYRKNYKGQPIERLGGLTELIPGNVMGIPLHPGNQKFNSTALRAGPFVQSVLGLSGKEADAAAEYDRKVMPFIPQANEGDATIESKLKQLRAFLNAQRANTYGQLGKPVPKPSSRAQNRKPGASGWKIERLDD